jgi:two-component system, OmpR family, response regulator
MTAAHRNILVDDDDQETAGPQVDSLTANGYRVNVAANGSDALSLGLSDDYTVIAVDRMLPDIDEIDVMRSLQGQCLLWVRSRHMRCNKPCPLYPQ